MYASGIDLVLITETWLQEFMPNGFLDPEKQFTIYRQDRPTCRTGGGVCALVSKRIKTVPVEVNTCSELVAFDAIMCGQKTRFIVAYRSPDYDQLAINYFGNLIVCLRKLMSVNYPVFIVGDFNCPNVNWDTLTSTSNQIHLMLCDFVCEHGLSQLVTQPTHGSNILDLVLTNDPRLVCSLSVEAPFSSSDHNCVVFKILYDHVSSCVCSDDLTLPRADGFTDINGFKSFLWAKGDYDAINSYLSAFNWDIFFSTNFDVEDIWVEFCRILQSAFELYIPLKTNMPSKSTECINSKYPRYLRRLVARKRCVWRQLRVRPDDVELRVHYKNLTNLCRKSILDFERKTEQKIIDANNVGAFYSFVNKKMRRRSDVGALKTANNELVTDDVSKANLLNKFFASVCTQDDGNLPYIDRAVPDDIELSGVTFTSESVLKAIAKIKGNASSGPDGLPPHVLKKLAPSISGPLSVMFTAFLSVSKLPRQWKTAVVTPVYKKGISSSCSNYRPISLTSVVLKIMERIIADAMLKYFSKHKLISNAQHGFLTRRSAVTNLIESLNDWTIGINHKHLTDVIYVDYAKAFDSVCHNKLLHKLSAFGVSGELLSWIRCFLTDRLQVTKVGSSLSSEAIVLTSGVAQGSCLGPLLFIVYVNDVVSLFSNDVKCKLFADDVKLYSFIKSDSDVETLQSNIDKLYHWSKLWQLSISTDKTVHVRIGKETFCVSGVYHLGQTRIHTVDEYKDLGIIVDPSLKFASHINHIVAKAHQRACLIFKTFTSGDRSLLVKAFNTYVRPLVEYGSCVWSPTAVGLIDKLEAVQRRFTKRIYGLQDISYRERLQILKLDSLECRRLRFDLILVYKILFGHTNLDVDDYFVLNSSFTRGHAYKLIPQHCNVNTRKYYFSFRVISVWNTLPSSIVNFNSLASFKHTLRKVRLSILTRF